MTNKAKLARLIDQFIREFVAYFTARHLGEVSPSYKFDAAVESVPATETRQDIARVISDSNGGAGVAEATMLSYGFVLAVHHWSAMLIAHGKDHERTVDAKRNMLLERIYVLNLVKD